MSRENLPWILWVTEKWSKPPFKPWQVSPKYGSVQFALLPSRSQSLDPIGKTKSQLSEGMDQVAWGKMGKMMEDGKVWWFWWCCRHRTWEHDERTCQFVMASASYQIPEFWLARSQQNFRQLSCQIRGDFRRTAMTWSTLTASFCMEDAKLRWYSFWVGLEMAKGIER